MELIEQILQQGSTPSAPFLIAVEGDTFPAVIGREDVTVKSLHGLCWTHAYHNYAVMPAPAAHHEGLTARLAAWRTSGTGTGAYNGNRLCAFITRAGGESILVPVRNASAEALWEAMAHQAARAA